MTRQAPQGKGHSWEPLNALRMCGKWRMLNAPGKNSWLARRSKAQTRFWGRPRDCWCIKCVSMCSRWRPAAQQVQLSHPGERSLKLGLKGRVSTWALSCSGGSGGRCTMKPHARTSPQRRRSCLQDTRNWCRLSFFTNKKTIIIQLFTVVMFDSTLDRSSHPDSGMKKTSHRWAPSSILEAHEAPL